jgi:hypothetical protein
VAPGKPALNLLTQALSQGDPQEKIAALHWLQRHPETNAVPLIYQIFFGGSEQERETACNTLWHLAKTGIELPDPAQFGLR